jgi:glucokinase
MGRLLGFDYGGTKIDIGLGTESGEILKTSRIKVADYPHLDNLIAASLEAGRELAAGETLHAVGVSTMGITHADHVDLAPNVPGWSTLHLPAVFEEAFASAPIFFENDVRSACLAESLWGSLKDVRHAAYLNLGTGIAMAFVIDGAVYTGAHGAAGEIAYLWRHGEAGFVNGRAPFEEQFGGVGIDRTVRHRFPPLKSLQDLFEDGSQAEREGFLAETFSEIARRVGHILLAFDVERVAVGGGIARRFDTFAPIFREEWRRHLPFAPELVKSLYVDRAGLHGALAVAVRR